MSSDTSSYADEYADSLMEVIAHYAKHLETGDTVTDLCEIDVEKGEVCDLIEDESFNLADQFLEIIQLHDENDEIRYIRLLMTFGGPNAALYRTPDQEDHLRVTVFGEEPEYRYGTDISTVLDYFDN